MNTNKLEFKVDTDTINFPGKTYLSKKTKAYLSDIESGLNSTPPKAKLKLSAINQNEYTMLYENKPAGKIIKNNFIDVSLNEIDVYIIDYSSNSYTIILVDEEEVMEKKKEEELKILSSLTSQQRDLIDICKEKYYFNDKHIKMLCDYWKLTPDYNVNDPNIKMPDLTKITLYEDNKENKIILNSLLSAIIGVSMWYNGPASCGKNIASITLSAILMQPYVEISVNEGSDKDDFLGSDIIENEKIGDNIVNKIVFREEPLVKAIENGYLCILDEFNLASPGFLPLLNSLTDTRKVINIPRYKRLEAHKNFRLILTSNEGYAGTSLQNSAFLSRFNRFDFYYPEDIVKLLSSNFSKKINRLYQNIREQVINQKNFCQECLFIRNYESFDKMLSNGADEKTALKICITNKIPRSKDASAITTIWERLL